MPALVCRCLESAVAVVVDLSSSYSPYLKASMISPLSPSGMSAFNLHRLDWYFHSPFLDILLDSSIPTQNAHLTHSHPYPLYVFVYLPDTAGNVSSPISSLLAGISAADQQQQQGQQETADQLRQRFSLLSCFREVPSLSGAGAAGAAGAGPGQRGNHGQQQQQLQHPQQEQQEQAQGQIQQREDQQQQLLKRQQGQEESGAQQWQQQREVRHEGEQEQLHQEQHHHQQQQQRKLKGQDLQQEQQNQLQIEEQQQQQQGPDVPSSSSLVTLPELPDEVLSCILCCLSPCALARVACCCRDLRSVSWEAVPGLRLDLYPHQVIGNTGGDKMGGGRGGGGTWVKKCEGHGRERFLVTYM